MTPLIGNQMIYFGDGSDYENKFHRLFVFYKQVISQTGFEKYTGINLAYANQVIAYTETGFDFKSGLYSGAKKCNGNDTYGTENGNRYCKNQGNKTAGKKYGYRTEPTEL